MIHLARLGDRGSGGGWEGAPLEMQLIFSSLATSTQNKGSPVQTVSKPRKIYQGAGTNVFHECTINVCTSYVRYRVIARL